MAEMCGIGGSVRSRSVVNLNSSADTPRIRDSRPRTKGLTG